MKIDDLQLEPNIINFLKSEGYTELYPPQKDAVKAGVLDSKSVLVSVPTASGTVSYTHLTLPTILLV